MKRRNIVIAPCGNKSFLFHQEWMKNEAERDFDICLLFYHESINQPDLYNKVDFFYHLKGFKYKMLHDLLVNIRPEWLDEYEFFYFLDDDIEIDTNGINQMFALTRALNASITQASLSHDSFCSWPMFRQHKDCFLRFVGQIEVMAPLFNRNALKICLESFIGNKSSWGMDSVWPKLLGYPENDLIVFDSVIMKHTLPVGGGELYTKIGTDPHEEWRSITTHYGAKLHNYREYGRMKILHRNSNISYRFLNLIRENYINIKRKITDYDVNSRVKNKWNKFHSI